MVKFTNNAKVKTKLVSLVFLAKFNLVQYLFNTFGFESISGTKITETKYHWLLQTKSRYNMQPIIHPSSFDEKTKMTHEIWLTERQHRFYITYMTSAHHSDHKLHKKRIKYSTEFILNECHCKVLHSKLCQKELMLISHKMNCDTKILHQYRKLTL